MDTQKTKIKNYLKRPYHRVLVPAEEGGFFAEIMEFPGCIAEGETASEAYQNVEDVAAAWIEGTLKDGEEIPSPAMDHSYSGKFALRLPRDLHRASAIKAARDGVSLNTCFVSAIAAWLGADNLFERMTQQIELNFFQMTNHIQVTTLWGTSMGSFVSSGTPWIMPWNAASVISGTMPSMVTAIPEGQGRVTTTGDANG
jgi:predicted RNase H-like HicB family nuclease